MLNNNHKGNNDSNSNNNNDINESFSNDRYVVIEIIS